LRHQSTASDKKPVPVSLPNQNRKPAAARAILRIAKPPKTGAKQPQTNNDFLYPPRHYTASGLLNLQTTLIRTMIRTTQGVKLLERR
jgi:hypothetical protein